MIEAGRDKARGALWQRNDRYLREFVETRNICPFARPCREQARLWRAICWAKPSDVARWVQLADMLESAPALIEVALLLLPGWSASSPQQLDEAHRVFRDAYQRRPGGASFYVVPFHPRNALSADNPGSLVRFWRKSPDPCLQFVHIETLDAVKRADPREEQSRLALRMFAAGRSAEEVLATLQGTRQRQGTSERVAAQNFALFQAVGDDQLTAELRSCGRPPLPPIDEKWEDVPWQAVSLQS